MRKVIKVIFGIIILSVFGLFCINNIANTADKNLQAVALGLAIGFVIFIYAWVCEIIDMISKCRKG
ncbi:MAG: hypothetical protein K0R00_87 [Herbinix sp.]|jgi:hypothetical protein|nr:hypothetical protein [Herbinix sp.]